VFGLTLLLQRPFHAQLQIVSVFLLQRVRFGIKGQEQGHNPDQLEQRCRRRV